MPISPALRGGLERSIDNIIETPKRSKMMFTEILKLQDIEPNLESMLRYLVGYIFGIITGQYLVLNKRMTNVEETKEIMTTIQRRMHEMREALVDPR